MKVKLNEMEQQLARYLGKKRFTFNRQKGIETKKFDGNNADLDIDIEGAAGELAFCKMFNLWPDLRENSFSPYDAKFWTGLSVDVKTTKYESGKLMVAPWKDRKPPDLYALIIGTMPNYRLVGWMPSGSLQNDQYWTGSGWAVQQEFLMRPEYLDVFIPKKVGKDGKKT